ncbi:ABC transporter permease [Kitasatospora herbaricolor]|uniref:ABC transporter permease n=1 Tax=Kitasatospora herbaricolor TaxID=68217 RepID=UPI00174C9FA1|nr:ABC transporter permease [Kitasatospora herbaricolor]MDQ0305875.1 peptide/nickel transport system permease protein [Kitasatospora herbaricolor]GGV38280.1 ABC transporter permease [Kitasatospora herbaricolor]
MALFLLRRLFSAAAILLLITGVTFFLFFQIPRDPARLACGQLCTPESLATIRHTMGIDQPVLVQFWDYVSGIFVGRTIGDIPCPAPCLGYSYVDQRPVLDILAARFPATLSVVVGVVATFLVFGIGAGMLAAWRRGTWLDKTVSGFALVGAAVQIYWLGIVATYVLVDQSALLPRPRYVPLGQDPGAWFGGLLLPWAVCAIIYIAGYSRYTRSSMIDTLGEEYVRTALAKGLSQRTVFFKYAFRGALTPIVTLLGLDLGVLFGGALITETTFNIPGIGQLAVRSVTNQDLPSMMAVTLVAAAALVFFTVVVDIAYAVIDPRVRAS